MLLGGFLKRLVPAVVVALAATMVMAAVGQAQTYNPKTQSHPGACSTNTLHVHRAVKDLNKNRVLAQYAQMIGVHWKKHHLARAMRRHLVVGRVKNAVITGNHGCTTHGLIFSVGSRRLHAGETVGVRLPKKYVGRACAIRSHKGCKRKVVKRAVVFPTNCWNVNFGTARVVIYVKPKPKKAKPVVKVADPIASASLTCAAPTSFGTTNGTGTLTLTLANGSTATASASFDVKATGNSTTGYAKTFGPLAAGKSLTESIPVDASGNNVVLTVTSGGKTIYSSTWPGGCPSFQGS